MLSCLHFLWLLSFSLSLTPIVLLCCTVLSFLLLSKCVPRAVQSCVELETKNPNFRCWSFALPCMPSFVRLNATSRSCKSRSLRKLEMWQQQQRHHPSVVSTVTDKMFFNFLFLSSQTYFPLVLSLSLRARGYQRSHIVVQYFVAIERKTILVTVKPNSNKIWENKVKDKYIVIFSWLFFCVLFIGERECVTSYKPTGSLKKRKKERKYLE